VFAVLERVARSRATGGGDRRRGRPPLGDRGGKGPCTSVFGIGLRGPHMTTREFFWPVALRTSRRLDGESAAAHHPTRVACSEEALRQSGVANAAERPKPTCGPCGQVAR